MAKSRGLDGLMEADFLDLPCTLSTISLNRRPTSKLQQFAEFQKVVYRPFSSFPPNTIILSGVSLTTSYIRRIQCFYPFVEMLPEVILFHTKLIESII